MDAKISLTLGIGLGQICTMAFVTPLTQQDPKANLQTDERGYEEFRWFSATLSEASLNGSKAEKTLLVQVSWRGKAPALRHWRSQALAAILRLSKTVADLNYYRKGKVKQMQCVCLWWWTKGCEIRGLKRAAEGIVLMFLEVALRKNLKLHPFRLIFWKV